MKTHLFYSELGVAFPIITTTKEQVLIAVRIEKEGVQVL